MSRRATLLPLLLACAPLACEPRPVPHLARATDRAVPAEPLDVSHIKPHSLEEEAVIEIPTPTPTPIEPAAPPRPEAVLASIAADTPLNVATSLRLTDEGRQLLQRGEVAAALDRLERAAKIDPENAHCYYWLAKVHYQRQRYDQAVAFADKAARLFARTDRAWQSQAYTFKASVLEQAGRYPEAREAYRRAVYAQTGNVAARAGVARLTAAGNAAAP